jgi:uncharacterized protein (TIGR02246 family)
MIMRKNLFFILALLMLTPAIARADAAGEANAVVDRWAATYSANDAEAIVKLYTPDAVLLGTVSPVIADSPEARRAYFSRLPGSGNRSSIADRRTIAMSDTAVLVAGFYDFVIMQGGKPVDSPARFTMLLVKRGNEWLIAHHHSSARPKPPQ